MIFKSTGFLGGKSIRHKQVQIEPSDILNVHMLIYIGNDADCIRQRGKGVGVGTLEGCWKVGEELSFFSEGGGRGGG